MNINLPPQPSRLMSRRDLLFLISHRGGPHVSVYLPTERAGPATRENPIRLKNLLREAEEGLIAGGMRPTEARDLLAPSRVLVENYDFWQQQSEGLCLHIAPDYSTLHRLPLRFPALAAVGDRFHVRPLLELFTADATFYLLAISLNDIRVFHCGRHGQEEIDIPDMPKNLADVLWPEDPEKQLQFRGARSGQAGEGAVFYGPEFGLEKKDQILSYFRSVDGALRPVLSTENAPLVVAAVDYLHPIYAEANTYDYLLPQGVVGSPDEVRAGELRAKAWQLVEPHAEQEWRRVLEQLASLQGTGRTSMQVDEIAREVLRGRVDSLLVSRAGVAWAKESGDGESFELHDAAEPGDVDLIDLAAVQTLAHGGHLYTLDQEQMPAASPAAAVFRY